MPDQRLQGSGARSWTIRVCEDHAALDCALCGIFDVVEVVPRADAEALQAEVDQLRAAIDTALRTTWVEDDEGGWGTEEDRIYADRLSALAALQPHWQEWGDAAYHLAGADLERRQIAERSAEALAEALEWIRHQTGVSTCDDAVRAMNDAHDSADETLAAYRAKHPKETTT